MQLLYDDHASLAVLENRMKSRFSCSRSWPTARVIRRSLLAAFFPPLLLTLVPCSDCFVLSIWLVLVLFEGDGVVEYFSDRPAIFTATNRIRYGCAFKISSRQKGEREKIDRLLDFSSPCPFEQTAHFLSCCSLLLLACWTNNRWSEIVAAWPAVCTAKSIVNAQLLCCIMQLFCLFPNFIALILLLFFFRAHLILSSTINSITIKILVGCLQQWVSANLHNDSSRFDRATYLLASKIECFSKHVEMCSWVVLLFSAAENSPWAFVVSCSEVESK